MTRRLSLLVPAALPMHHSSSRLCPRLVCLRAYSTSTDSPVTASAAKPLFRRLHLREDVPDERQSSPGHTIFTAPGATKDAVLTMLRRLEMPKDWQHAAVILASPQHASWLTDQKFMADFLKSLARSNPKPAHDTKIHVLAAVVDGLHPLPRSREMQEGLSFQLGSLHGLLPGLWDEVPDETVESRPGTVEAGSESAHISLVLRRANYSGRTVTVNMPLANTLFHNGRRTTLLASQWRLSMSQDRQVELLQLKEKRTQIVDLPTPPEQQKIVLRSPLVPITHPRKIVEGLGNILAKVEIEGEVAPASREIQANIPLLLKARQALGSKLDSARIGVWALIMPDTMIVEGETSISPTRSTRAGRFGAVADKLAFEFTNPFENTAWQRANVLGAILLRGGRLHKILSGGGEWGAKASLLSLDPQTSYGVESEEDELDRFQRSFNGEDNTNEAITRPGDYVQFFVEGDSDTGHMPQRPTSLPVASFGVADVPKAGEVLPRAGLNLVRAVPNHFGAFSAEGIYLDLKMNYGSRDTSTTKVNSPGTSIGPFAP